MESKRSPENKKINYESKYQEYCRIRDQIEEIKANPLGTTNFVVYAQLYRREHELDDIFPEGKSGLRESLDKTYELNHRNDISAYNELQHRLENEKQNLCATYKTKFNEDKTFEEIEKFLAEHGSRIRDDEVRNLLALINKIYRLRTEITPNSKALEQTLELQKLKSEKSDLESSGIKIEDAILKANIKNIDTEIYLLTKAYEENEEKEKNRYFTEQFLSDSENSFQPLFYLMLSFYRYLKTVWTLIPESIDRIISYVTMGIGKAFNLLYIFHLWRDTTTPQRTIKTVNALFNFLAAIANITTTALKTNPYAQGIISFISIMLSLYKDSRSVNATLNEIEASENELAKLKRLQEKLKKNKEPNVLLAQLPSKINFYEKKIAEKNKSNRFDDIRSLIFTSINTFFGLSLLASSIVLAWPLAFPAIAPAILSDIAYVALSIQLPLTILDILDQYYDCPATRWISNNKGICMKSALIGLSVGAALSYSIFAGSIVPMILGGITAGISLVVGTYRSSVVSNKNDEVKKDAAQGIGTAGIAKELGFSPSPDHSSKHDNQDIQNARDASRRTYLATFDHSHESRNSPAFR